MVQGTLEKRSQQICKYYVKGRCRYGNNCKFIHTASSYVGDRVISDSSQSGDTTSTTTSGEASSQATTTTRSDDSGVKALPKINKPCRLWQGGNCRWGAKCRFRHDGEAGSPLVNAEGSGISATGTSERVGDARAADTDDATVSADTTWKGKGRYVERNPFRSNELARQERQLRLAREREQKQARERERIQQRRRLEEAWAKEATVTIQKVVLNSFVQFEAGLTIQRVICGFEVSQILVKNLPLDAQRSEIMALFTQQGVDPDDIAILKMDTVDGRLQATVMGRANDVEVIALGLDGVEFRDENLEFVVCERNSDGRTMGSSNRDFHPLNISYPKPFQTMVIKYHYPLDIYSAEEKKEQLSGKRLKGQALRTTIIYDRHDDDYEPLYSIQLSRIPADTTIAEVQTFADAPHVELDPNALSYTSDEVFNALEAHLRGLPRSTFQRLIPGHSPRPNFVSLQAVFDTWESAKSANDNLSGRILRTGFPSLRLFLPDPYRFVLTLDENQYNAQKAQWSELCEGKSKEVTIQTRTIDRVGGRKVIITLFGRDKKMVGALKVRIEGMAAGQNLDASYWHPTFKDPKRSNEFFDDLYHSTGAYVRSDWKHNCLTVSGGADATEAAKTRIKEEVERISAEEWTIPLQRRALGFFIREGLAKMKGLLGEENVTLDVKSAKIVLHGADLEEARHHLRQLMTAFLDQNASSSSSAATSDENPCPVCYDTVSQPFEIGCQHIYCSSCLRHYILSTLDNHSFPLKCMGNDATCNQPLSLPLIQRFLPHQRFEQLMEAAFRSYIDKNPETFKYCTTPGCSQVYRATTFPQVLACPSCFAEVCTACFNEGHTGMTCAERRVHKDAGEQERLLRQWANQSGVKRCPSCQAYVEKNAGCNHMSCKCGTHFCWICLGTFDSTSIYDHMAEVHGGIYNDPEPRVNARQHDAGQAQPNNVPDIVDVVGGPAAAAEQIAALRRIEADRVRLAPNFGGANLGFLARAAVPVPVNAEREATNRDRLLRERQDRERELAREREVEQRRLAEERREALVRYYRLTRERREREQEQNEREQRERERMRNIREREEVRIREVEARRREAQENKGWCTIM